MGKRKGTPDDIDYLFERDIIHEEDYVEFWQSYWKSNKREQRQLIDDYLEIANESTLAVQLAGVVTRNKSEARKQASTIGGYVVRRNAKGQFSRRGRYFQAVRKSKHANGKTKTAKKTKTSKRRH